MPVVKDGNIVKIAVQMDKSFEGVFHPQLIEFDQKRNLNLIIADLCTSWEISDCDQYSLQFSNATNDSNAYITEKNRNEIKNGTVLNLGYSPSRTSQDILNKLKFDDPLQMKGTFQKLVNLCRDYTFALEFINKQGLQWLIEEIEKGEIAQYDGFGLALESFVELMNHGIISWDNLEPKFIGKIACQVNIAGASPNPDAKILINSLAILESIVVSGTKFNSLVESEVTLPNLISSVQQNASNPEIQQNSIALINALFSKSDMSKRKAMAATLSSKHIRNVILTQVLHPRVSGVPTQQVATSVGSEMAHQLYVLQSLLFNLHEEKMNTVVTANNETETRERILELRKYAFESEMMGGDGTHKSRSLLPSSGSGSGSAGMQDDYKTLGFTNSKLPMEEFMESPPGLLALDLMLYFAKNHNDSFFKFLFENSARSDRGNECPFARSSVRLTKLICEILKVNDPPSDEGKLFYPMFFTHDHPLEEFFCLTVPLLNKTWKEMRATEEDFVKVIQVIKQQLTRALVEPEWTVTFEKYKQKLNTLPYSVISGLWKKERSSREEWENKAQAILELREMIKPSTIELIKEQRYNYLMEGTQFVKYSNKGQRVKDKFWFCRLSTNRKYFCYGDCDENRKPSVDELPNKFAVIDIKQLVTSKECPHMKDAGRGKKSTFALAFSLIPDAEQEEALNFVAPNEKVFDYWTDGINALIGQEMVSKETNNDLDTLLSMEIKLRLLDTEGVNIPEKPPEIPPSPPNYDFTFKFA